MRDHWVQLQPCSWQLPVAWQGGRTWSAPTVLLCHAQALPDVCRRCHSLRRARRHAAAGLLPPLGLPLQRLCQLRSSSSRVPAGAPMDTPALRLRAAERVSLQRGSSARAPACAGMAATARGCLGRAHRQASGCPRPAGGAAVDAAAGAALPHGRRRCAGAEGPGPWRAGRRVPGATGSCTGTCCCSPVTYVHQRALAGWGGWRWCGGQRTTAPPARCCGCCRTLFGTALSPLGAQPPGGLQSRQQAGCCQRSAGATPAQCRTTAQSAPPGRVPFPPPPLSLGGQACAVTGPPAPHVQPRRSQIPARMVIRRQVYVALPFRRLNAHTAQNSAASVARACV